jgi:hypothetical protein
MTHKTAIVCSLVVGLLGVRPLVRQGCGVVMTKNYSMYATASADTSHIYTSVVTDGSASCTPSLACPCNTATHTPESYNKIGTVGGWGTGTPQCVNCYLSYTNNQNTVATAGVAYPFQASGEVNCSIVGTFFSASLPGLNEAQNPNCGSGNGQVITIFTPPQAKSSNGTTTYTAGMSVAGSGINHVSDVLASTTTDVTLILELLGGPTLNIYCPNTAGGNQWCFNQNYKAHKVAPNKGNIKWDVKIYCGAKVNPDIDAKVDQAFQCL